MRRFWIIPVVTIVIITTIAAAGGLAITGHASEASKRQVGLDLAALTLPAYEPQRVVYQVDEGGGWFGHGFRTLIGGLENHVAAVGAGNVDIRVVLQGKGIDLLRDPNAAMRARIDRLRAGGVRFVVCRNSLIQSVTEPSDLYGVGQHDVARAGVAEIAMLDAKGFVYIRP